MKHKKATNRGFIPSFVVSLHPNNSKLNKIKDLQIYVNDVNKNIIHNVTNI